MKGWLDNYNDSKTTAPDNYQGDGYSNVGRNYSPAWGGQFQLGGNVYPVNYVPQAQMGGTIAGAPGFSYARIQGAAPSNGKYAKKTMASAQDGIRSNKLIPPKKESSIWDSGIEAISSAVFHPLDTAKAVVSTISDYASGESKPKPKVMTEKPTINYSGETVPTMPAKESYNLLSQYSENKAIRVGKRDELGNFTIDRGLGYTPPLKTGESSKLQEKVKAYKGDVSGLKNIQQSQDPDVQYAINKQIDYWQNPEVQKMYLKNHPEYGGDIKKAQQDINTHLALGANYEYVPTGKFSKQNKKLIKLSPGASANVFYPGYNQTYTDKSGKVIEANPMDASIGNARDLRSERGIVAYQPYNKSNSREQLRAELAHEFGAHSTGFAERQGDVLGNILGDPTEQPGRDKTSNVSDITSQGRQYLSRKDEMYGKFKEYKELLNLTPGQKVTPKQLEALEKKHLKPSIGTFESIFDLNRKAKAINEVAQLDNTQQDPNIQTAQNGKEMQYYQNGLDFQPKTISRNGSWLSKYDKAQTGKQVEYGTPEYREAYNKGEVVTDQGVRSPIQLDEVVVSKKSPAPGFWKQSKDRFLKDNQDASVLGAIGAGVMYPFGIPQEAMMYGLTDKVQDPSEAWGYNTKERWFDSPGAFGRNLVDFSLNQIDPANLIGAGILTKENALEKLATSKKSKILPKLSKSLEIGPLPKNTDVTPWYSNIKNKIFGEPDQNKSYIYDDIKQMVHTDEGRKRLINMGVDPSNIRKLLIIENPANVEWPSVKSVSEHPIGSHYSSKKNQIVMDARDSSKAYADQTAEQVREHELGHWLQDAFMKQSGKREKFVNKMLAQGKLTKDKADELLNFDTKKFVTPIDEELINLFPKDTPIKGKWNPGLIDPINYFHNELPGYDYTNLGNTRNIGTQMKFEPLAFAREFRRKLLESGYIKNKYDPITEDMVNDFIQKDLKNIDVKDKMNRISSFATSKETPKLTNILNRLPAAVPVVIGLGAASQTEQKRDGGIIKDDRGQWDHPDEPTRISGSNITMKPDPITGKPLTKPILGIADTGEEQMMYPGEDYNFEGAEYVDEYPKGKKPKKAQNGLRQEQKGLQNLDNLTNFTNYNKPQPGSWLEKYN